METYNEMPSPPEPRKPADHVRVRPDLQSVGGVLVGSVLFVTGGILTLTVIGIPFGMLMFAVGLGLMLESGRRDRR